MFVKDKALTVNGFVFIFVDNISSKYIEVYSLKGSQKLHIRVSMRNAWPIHRWPSLAVIVKKRTLIAELFECIFVDHIMDFIAFLVFMRFTVQEDGENFPPVSMCISGTISR